MGIVKDITRRITKPSAKKTEAETIPVVVRNRRRG